VRDVLGSIVDDDRQLISEETVTAADDEVTRIAGKVRGPQSLQPVLERDDPGCDSESDRERPVGCPHSVATPTGVVQLVGQVAPRRLRGLKLGPAARAVKGETCREELIERGLIGSVTLALSDYGPGPLEAECGERRDDLVGAAWNFARRIEIFDSQQPVAAGVPRVEITGSRCDERPEVQRTGRRGSETTAVFAADRRDPICSDRLDRRTAFPDVRGAPAPRRTESRPDALRVA
jgi:hypothetical protein